MKKLYIVLLLMLFGNMSMLNAQEELSLSDAINLGLENNYNLRVTQKSEEISQINNTWGNTGIMPSINLTANARENFNFNDNENYRAQTISPELSLNWVFFDGFSAKISKQKFEELEELSKGNTAVLVENTIQDIILAYYNCVLQKEMIEVYVELEELSRDRYERSENSKKIGASTTYESLQAKTSWLEDQSNLLQQKVNYENSIRVLNYSLAVEEDLFWNLTNSLDFEIPDYKMEDLKAKMSMNNQTLKNQYLNQSLQAKETALAKSNYYPKLSLSTGINNSDVANYYSGNTPDMAQNSSNAYIGINLSFNIFNGGITRRSVQIAQISEETEQIQTNQMEHSLNNQLLQMYSNYTLQKSLLELADQKVSAAKLNVELSNAKLKNGSINSFNYRDVQTMYMNAAIAQFRSIYQLIEANTDLLRISGGIINEFNK